MKAHVLKSPTREEFEQLAAPDPRRWSVGAIIHVEEMFPQGLRPLAREALHFETQVERRDEIVAQLGKEHPSETQALFNVTEFYRRLPPPTGC